MKAKPKVPAKSAAPAKKSPKAAAPPPRPNPLMGQPPVAQGAGVMKRTIQLPVQPIGGSTLASLLMG